MLSNTTPDGRTDLLRKLLEICEDPQVKGFALRRAGGDPDLAEDARRGAVCAIARCGKPERIEDLRAYFYKVLIREIYRLQGQLNATLVEDFDSLERAPQHGVAACNSVPPRPVDETVGTSIVTETWFERFAAQHDDLCTVVPGRSHDPDRYQELIVAKARQILPAIADGSASLADCNQVLRTAYPEWFDEVGCAANTAQQRFSRARADIRKVLMIVINRDELR